jgi:CheY-like chemotaxis protein
VPRILLLDDDIAEISSVKRVLARAGHQPVLATNAADAQIALAGGPPDLLLVGVTCDDGQGLALLHRVAEGGAAPFRVIVLGEAAGLPEGAVALARPVDPAQLVDEVAAALAGGAGEVKRATPTTASTTGAARRAAAEALQARAEELRRGQAAAVAAPVAPTKPVPAAATQAAPAAARNASPAVKAIPAAAKAAPAKAVPAAAAKAVPAKAVPADAVKAPPGAEVEDDGLEALLRRAEEAERRHLAERTARVRQKDRATVEAAQRAEAERIAVEQAAGAREAEESARRHTEVEGRRTRDAEGTARSEAAARRRAEAELETLRVQLDSERRTAEQRIHTVMERAAAEEQAAEELRRLAEDEVRARADAELSRREEEEEALRSAIASARAEMEALRRRGEEEARRREQAEAELRRVEEAARRPQPPPAFDFPADGAPPRATDPIRAKTGGDDELASEELARRRVAALRGRAVDPPAAPEAAASWFEDAPAAREPAAPARGLAAAGDAPPAAVLAAPPPELRSGTLADVPAPRLLALAARARLGGRVDVQGEGARSVYFEEGRIVGATSADPAERIEELALRLGLVTRDQHRQIAGAAIALPSRRAALLLLERGFLKPTELTGLVRRRTEEVVFGLFAEPAARFRWAAAEVPADERILLERGTLAVAVEGVRRRWLAPRLDAVLGGPGTLLAPVAGAPSAADLGLAPEERRAVALADGLRALEEIVAASPLDPLTTRQVLAALVLVGALTVRVLQAGRPAAAASAAIDLARVREKLDQVRRADYFTILGVGRHCTPHEVKEAAERLGAEFSPSRFAAVSEDGLGPRLDEITQVVIDAREVLADDRLREEYLRGLGA